MNWLSLGTSLAKIGAPMLASVFLGPEAGPLVGVLVGKLADALGCPATPDAVQNAIATDPAAATKVQAVEATHADTISAYLEDVQNARTMTVSLSSTSSWMQYGAAVVTVMVLLGYMTVATMLMTGHGTETPMSLAVYGTFSTFAGAAVAFWLGSSRAASQRTDQALEAAYKAAPAGKRK